MDHRNRPQFSNVKAQGGGLAAGIGSGSPYDGSKPQGTCGNISITSGVNTVTANRGSSDNNGNYDIGKGNGGLIRDGESDGTITIAASVTSSDGKHYVAKGTYGYDKE